MALAPSPTHASPPAASHQLRVLARAAWVTALRQNAIYVLLLLLGIYAAAAVILRITGIETPQAARFVLGLGLQLGSVLSAALALIGASRALPPELEQRTIYPVLAKPVSRPVLLLGKALPIWLMSIGALLLFAVASLAIAPGLTYQMPMALAQALMLKALALGVVTALALALSLYLPAAVGMLVAAALVFGGGMLANTMQQASSPLLHWLGLALPDFSLFEQFTRYTDGGAPLAPGALLPLCGYALLWGFLLAGLAARRFKRIAL